MRGLISYWYEHLCTMQICRLELPHLHLHFWIFQKRTIKEILIKRYREKLREKPREIEIWLFWIFQNLFADPNLILITLPKIKILNNQVLMKKFLWPMYLSLSLSPYLAHFLGLPSGWECSRTGAFGPPRLGLSLCICLCICLCLWLTFEILPLIENVLVLEPLVNPGLTQFFCLSICLRLCLFLHLWLTFEIFPLIENVLILEPLVHPCLVLVFFFDFVFVFVFDC